MFVRLRTWLQGHYTGILAFHEACVRSGECRLSGYVTYHSAAQRTDNKSRASVYVSTDHAQHEVDLSSSSFVTLEYAAIYVRLRGSYTKVVLYTLDQGLNISGTHTILPKSANFAPALSFSAETLTLAIQCGAVLSQTFVAAPCST